MQLNPIKVHYCCPRRHALQIPLWCTLKLQIPLWCALNIAVKPHRGPLPLPKEHALQIPSWCAFNIVVKIHRGQLPLPKEACIANPIVVRSKQQIPLWCAQHCSQIPLWSTTTAQGGMHCKSHHGALTNQLIPLWYAPNSKSHRGMTTISKSHCGTLKITNQIVVQPFKTAHQGISDLHYYYNTIFNFIIQYNTYL